MENFSAHFGPLKNSYRVAYLISGFLQKNLSIEEEEELDKWMLRSESNMQLFEDLTEESTIGPFLKWYQASDVEKNLAEVKRKLKFRTIDRLAILWRWAAAASIAAVLGIGGAYWYFNHRPVRSAGTAVKINDVQPGSELAILKFGDTGSLALSSAKDTLINDHVQIRNGEIVYTADNDGPLSFNEISIPRKGFFRLLLPDGTRVWLNSESKLRFPSQFSGATRNVTASGETYFDVAKNPSQPFIVSVNGIQITALGTAFNINAYPAENSFIATLIHGIIKVSDGNNLKVLKPLDQIVASQGTWRVNNGVDAEPIMAWTNNQFKFKNASIEEIMQQMVRWYDVKVKYQDRVSYHFNGTIDRSVPLSRVLKLLQQTGNVSFEVTDNEVVVKK